MKVAPAKASLFSLEMEPEMRCWASRRELYKMDKQYKTNKIFFMASFFILIGCKIIEYAEKKIKFAENQHLSY